MIYTHSNQPLEMGCEMVNSSDLLPVEGCSRRRFGGAVLAAAAASAFPFQAFSQTLPKRGGRVRLALAQQSTNDTFDSAKFTNANDYIRGSSLYSYLVRIDAHGAAQPEVAISWEPSADARKWTFKIRPGIKFSDGSALRLEDIVFSVMRHKDAAVASSAKQLVQTVESVVADGTSAVVVTLSEPNVDFPILMGSLQFALVKAGTTDFSKPIGTGPFILKSFQPGIRTTLARNPGYWREGRPYIDELEMFSITDASARANALLAGDVEMITDLRGAGIDQVKANSATRAFVTPSTRYTAFQLAVDQPPGDKSDLGLALSHLLDRQRILDTVLKGYGEIANDHPIGKSSPFFNTSLPQRQLDLDKAKFHIGRSGIGQAPVEISVSEGVVYSVEMGQILQREGSRAGLNIQLRREPTDSYWTAVAGKRAIFATNFFARPTYNLLLSLTWKTGSQWNYSHFSNPSLDKLIDATRSTLDVEKRKAMYAEIQSTIHNSGAIAMPCFLSYVDGVSASVNGLVPNPTGNLGGFRFSDEIWIS